MGMSEYGRKVEEIVSCKKRKRKIKRKRKYIKVQVQEIRNVYIV